MRSDRHRSRSWTTAAGARRPLRPAAAAVRADDAGQQRMLGIGLIVRRRGGAGEVEDAGDETAARSPRAAAGRRYRPSIKVKLAGVSRAGSRRPVCRLSRPITCRPGRAALGKVRADEPAPPATSACGMFAVLHGCLASAADGGARGVEIGIRVRRRGGPRCVRRARASARPRRSRRGRRSSAASTSAGVLRDQGSRERGEQPIEPRPESLRMGAAQAAASNRRTPATIRRRACQPG